MGRWCRDGGGGVGRGGVVVGWLGQREMGRGGGWAAGDAGGLSVALVDRARCRMECMNGRRSL